MNEMHMRKRHLFCTSTHHNVQYEKQQELNKGSDPRISDLARTRGQLLNSSTLVHT